MLCLVQIVVKKNFEILSIFDKISSNAMLSSNCCFNRFDTKYNISMQNVYLEKRLVTCLSLINVLLQFTAIDDFCRVLLF